MQEIKAKLPYKISTQAIIQKSQMCISKNIKNHTDPRAHKSNCDHLRKSTLNLEGNLVYNRMN